MVEIKPIASSSAGNCHWISDGKTPIFLDAGVSLPKIRKVIGHNVSSAVGCLITHGHL